MREAVSNDQRCETGSRVQIVLLAGQQHLTVPAMAKIEREGDQTVRNWLKRWMAEEIEGLKVWSMAGLTLKFTEVCREQFPAAVRRRPRI